MAEIKTRPTSASVSRFLNGIADAEKRRDGFALVEIMKRLTDAEPVMWGASIVGFGTYHYKYASGREADWPIAGFSPRKQNLTVYVMPGFMGQDEDLLGRLGKHSVAKSCLYIKRLADVDLSTLETLIARSVGRVRAAYPAGPSKDKAPRRSKARKPKSTGRPKKRTR
jgi:hypothetical protein